MTQTEAIGRPNQRRRTRKDLLQAAARLMKHGRMPTIEDVAQEALVSRATAYRYFPSVEALMREAALDVAMPQPSDALADVRSTDPVTRLERVDGAMHDFILENETALRLMLAHAIEQGARPEADGEEPRRQNRRLPMIEAAVEPAREQFPPADLTTLVHALASSSARRRWSSERTSCNSRTPRSGRSSGSRSVHWWKRHERRAIASAAVDMRFDACMVAAK